MTSKIQATINKLYPGIGASLKPLESDDDDKMSLVCEELIKIKGLTKLQRMQVDLMIGHRVCLKLILKNVLKQSI